MIHDGVRQRWRKDDDGNVGILVCPKRSQSKIRAPRHDDNDAVVLSPSPIHIQDTRNCIVCLGLPDLQKAGPCFRRTQEMGQEETHLSSELHVQNLSETLPSPFCAIQEEMVGEPAS